MIVFNEGLPGSGKSYDAVVTHILPALKRGRHVYARLNGLEDPKRHVAIAEFLGVEVEQVNAHLHHVTDAEVHNIGAIVEKNALVVIDECHEFYVASREALPKDKEELFAKHRHEGLDIILISQYYKRLHSAVRGRVERKAIFTKLTVLKSSHRYKVEHQQAVAPDKYEKVDSVIKKYDPKIFPLYRSVAEGTTNLEVYKEGSVSAFRKIGMYGFVLIPLGIVAVYVLVKFFSGNSGLVRDKPVPGVVSTAPPTPIEKVEAKITQRSAQIETGKKKGFDTTGMPPPIAYIFDIAAQGRPRLAAIAIVEGKPMPYGVVEFRESQGHVLERVTIAELADMGFKVTVRSWGVSLASGTQTIVATQWPIDMPGALTQPSLAPQTPAKDWSAAKAPKRREDRPLPANLPHVKPVRSALTS